jgi:hypothetical protein
MVKKNAQFFLHELVQMDRKTVHFQMKTLIRYELMLDFMCNMGQNLNFIVWRHSRDKKNIHLPELFIKVIKFKKP